MEAFAQSADAPRDDAEPKSSLQPRAAAVPAGAAGRAGAGGPAVVHPLTPSAVVLASIGSGIVFAALFLGSAVAAGSASGLLIAVLIAAALLAGPAGLGLRLLTAEVRVDDEWVTYVTWAGSHAVHRSRVAAVESGNWSSRLIDSAGGPVLGLGSLWERGAPARLAAALGVPVGKPGRALGSAAERPD